ncbi:MAG: YXWGXW repeat-containing protein [Alphaproteobacteria bacterium]
MLKRLIMTTVLVGALAAPAFADSFDIDIGVAPPAPRYEAVPAPRPGYTWAAGYWGWDDGRHVWHEGRWVAERPGYRWVNDKWTHHGNQWGHSAGHWAADPRWDHNRDVENHDANDNGRDWHR